MTEKTNPQGGMQADKDTQALEQSLLGYQRRQAAWRELRVLALERLREIVKDPRGVECPAIIEAGRRLAVAEPGAMEAPFNAFKDAMLIGVRAAKGADESGAIRELAERSCDFFLAMAEATHKELEASQAAALVRAQTQRSEGRRGAAGLH